MPDESHHILYKDLLYTKCSFKRGYYMFELVVFFKKFETL